MVAVAAALLAGCGDDGPTTTPTTTTAPPPQPAAVIAVSGNGDIAIHPSADAAFGAAIEFPIHIQETGGGTAVWNFFRVSYFKAGVEVERNEKGADDIQAAGHRNIAARATVTAHVITRTNAFDWDDVELRFGFIDSKDGRAFEHVLERGDFDGVVIDLTPALLPEGSSFAIVETPE
jgi:hypothetical protein